MAVTMTAGIRPHNQKAAEIWGSGGRDYDAISATVADAMNTLKDNEEILETLNTIFLLDGAGHPTATVGSPADQVSFSRSRCCRRCFGDCSCTT